MFSLGWFSYIVSLGLTYVFIVMIIIIIIIIIIVIIIIIIVIVIITTVIIIIIIIIIITVIITILVVVIFIIIIIIIISQLRLVSPRSYNVAFIPTLNKFHKKTKEKTQNLICSWKMYVVRGSDLTVDKVIITKNLKRC